MSDTHEIAGLDAASILAALTMPKTGQVFDLGSGWWRGMPGHYAHPRFDVVTYRTPRGERNQKDLDFLDPAVNKINFGFISELVMGTTHTGSHIDALCHVTCGENDEWYGGGSANDDLGDFGALKNDASQLPPFIARGVMLDIPAALSLDVLPPNYGVGPDELEAACARQGVEVTPGTVVMVRTGMMKNWPDGDAMAAASADAGLNYAGAQWLLERGARAVGADTAAMEVVPSGIDGQPQPVHILLIKENGVHILEWMYLENLANAGISEFLFLAMPLTITGATGSMLRPVAIV